MGPLLFIIYSADVTQHIQNCKFHICADDIQVYISVKPSDTHIATKYLNEDLERIGNWAKSNSLVLNGSKSKYLILGSKDQIKKISSKGVVVAIGGQNVERVSEARNLGLVMGSYVLKPT